MLKYLEVTRAEAEIVFCKQHQNKNKSVYVTIVFDDCNSSTAHKGSNHHSHNFLNAICKFKK